MSKSCWIVSISVCGPFAGRVDARLLPVPAIGMKRSRNERMYACFFRIDPHDHDRVGALAAVVPEEAAGVRPLSSMPTRLSVPTRR